MEYKTLGKSGLKISVIGFGGIPIQKTNEEEVKNLLIRCEEKGINFIDTARGYTVSEEYIGYAMEGRREKWIIATKSMARDKESMIKDVEKSLVNLRTDYIDLYQLHNVKTKEDYDKVLSGDGAYNALLEMKEKGKIGHIGITSHSLDILNVAIETGKFESIMYPYNIVENQGEGLFKRAKELNIGVIAMKPMAGGALRDGKLALKYILQNTNITTAIPGMATFEEIEENSKVGKDIRVLTDEEKNNIRIIAEELGTEFCRRCGYCGPCVQSIDIPGIFVLKAYKERYGLPKWAEERYFSLKSRAKDCIECGSCEKKCPYDLPIRKMLKEVRVCFND
ncbi:putative aldo/keto reductase-like oxidoreductase [Clostridium tetanomorphum]|uniref:Aldo/keto reductase n=1 Tax=Clostridium tetanomorphum TaxID=1553 RepID=A0A923IZY6_CLOTT|nr:aldo/keto reductase [Clostridium tetanomorphum]KAJ53191.1 aldo/keto reductase family oxidoreductase [Clostridium tetanomorphum DSM 665]MBC2397497.1 aldo/keto reductase [Clostridium tetanomorphum]MBP1863593.1 putative aldo/keto reductase-like oxidoreductase [Clostridium tetanomorphum]NRS86169.1 putative aldo/keto reductase-like oxidoreductase [Clostridium tetanomorphum]NRZ95752.1 putative aldo/keto reductase-like oxidoreductase [Clostridium tetanomorphum]